MASRIVFALADLVTEIKRCADIDPDDTAPLGIALVLDAAIYAPIIAEIENHVGGANLPASDMGGVRFAGVEIVSGDENV